MIVWGQNPSQDSASYFMLVNSDLLEQEDTARLDSSLLVGKDYFLAHELYIQLLSLYNQSGDYYLQKRSFEKALALLQKTSDLSLPAVIAKSAEMATNFHLQGLAHHNMGNLNNAWTQYEKSLSIRQSDSSFESEAYVRLLRNMGSIQQAWGRHASAVRYFRKSIEMGSRVSPKPLVQLAAAEYSISVVYLSLQHYDSAEFFARKSLMTKLAGGFSDLSVSVSRNGLANALSAQGEFEEAEVLYLKAGDSFNVEMGPVNLYSAGVYNNLSDLYHLMALNHQALMYGEKALKIYEALFGENHPNTALVYNNLGTYHLHNKETSLAISLYKKALAFYAQAGQAYRQSYRNTQLNLGAAYLNRGAPEEALRIYFPLKDSIDGLGFITRMSITNNLAKAYLDLGKPELALENLIVEGGSNGSERVARARLLSAHAYKDMSDYEAFDHLMQVLLQDEDLSQKDLFEVHMLFFDRLLTLQANTDSLISVLSAAEDIMSRERLNANNQNDKLSWVKELGMLTARGMKTSHNAYQQTGHVAYLQAALEFSESSKARLLAESVVESNARQFGGVPVRLTDLERHLKSKIAFFERSALPYAKDSLFASQDRFLRLIRRYETEFPEYHRLKFSASESSLNTVQQQLEAEVLISYVNTEGWVYALIVTENDTNLIRLGESTLISSTMTAFYEALQNQEPLSRYAGPSAVLFEQLVAPLIKTAGPVDKWIIIPDPTMLHVPFEALLTRNLSKAEVDRGDFRGLPFMVRGFEISYHYSVSLWQQSRQRQKAGSGTFDFLGFAPFSEGKGKVATTRGEDLAILPESGNELSEIYAMLAQRGNSVLAYWSDKATLSVFQEQAERKDVIHIASHSFPDYGTGRLAKIAFKADAINEDSVAFLYASDIYGLQLEADLVVLSSCESAAGKLYQGEGVFSLARSFHYAGAQNVISSQWELPDNHARRLSVAFYQQLGKVSDRSYRSALTLAKRQLIGQASSPYYHPAFWSNFVLYGR